MGRKIMGHDFLLHLVSIQEIKVVPGVKAKIS